MKTSSGLLLALTPLTLGTAATAQAEEGSVEYVYGNYREGDLAAGKSASGKAVERYQVDTHLFRVQQPLGGSDSLSLDLTHERMSGASPWYVMPDAQGRAVQVMSGASISDMRNAIDAGWRHDWGRRGNARVGAGYSQEEDYRSWQASLEGELKAWDGMQSVTAGLSYFDDRLTPTDGGSPFYPGRVEAAGKQGGSLYAGIIQVLTPRDQFRATLSTLWQQGFLSDPYKLAYLTGSASTVPDSRPDSRVSVSLATQFRHSFASPGLALHADYRYFRDDWQIEAHTLSLGLFRSGSLWDWSASLRWYSQSQADFYAPFYDTLRSDGLASSDYRLSPYGALGANLDLGRRLGAWRLAGGLGVYRASEDYALGSVEMANPGLVSWLNGYFQVSRQY